MLVRLLVLSVCLAGAAGVAGSSRTEEVPPRRLLAGFPATVGRWRNTGAAELDPSVVAGLGVDDYLNRVYESGTAYLGLYIAYYATQRQGDTMHSPLNCLPGAGWEPLGRTYLGVQLADGRTVTVNRYIIEKGLDRQVVLYWYQSHGRVIANEYMSKVNLVYDAIRLNRTDAALVRVVSPMAAPTPEAELRASDQAVDFVRAMFPALPAHIPS